MEKKARKYENITGAPAPLLQLLWLLHFSEHSTHKNYYRQLRLGLCWGSVRLCVCRDYTNSARTLNILCNCTQSSSFMAVFFCFAGNFSKWKHNNTCCATPQSFSPSPEWITWQELICADKAPTATRRRLQQFWMISTETTTTTMKRSQTLCKSFTRTGNESDAKKIQLDYVFYTARLLSTLSSFLIAPF